MTAPVETAAKPAKTLRAARPKPVVVHREEPAPETLTPPTLLSPPIGKVNSVTETIQGYEELTAFGKANIEALVEANSIFVKGVEEISKELFGLTRASLEHAAAATTAIFSAKTLKDMVELNADFTKAQYEKLLANTTRLGELTVKLATESSAPITARANRVVETVVRPAA